jgi:hypothetical protein
MPGKYHVYVDIYIVYTWIYHASVYPLASDWIYPWILYHVTVYPPSIYMVYPWILVYHLMYIHGIYVVYRGISMNNPSFLKPDFAASPCCWSHSMRTRVWVIKSVLFHAPHTRHHGKCARGLRGNGCPQKAQPDCRQRSLPVAGGGGDGSGGGRCC